jgi:hypothetical protein
MFELSGSGKNAVGHQDSFGMETNKTNRSRENVNEIYRFVLEELQKESHTAAYRKMIATDNYRDLVGQHHLQP